MNGYVVVVCTGGKWQSNDGEDRYVRETVNNFGLLIPKEFNYEFLEEKIKERIFVGEDQELLLSFKHPDEGYVMNMVNDGDVSLLKWVITSSSMTVHVYTVVRALEVQERAVPSSRKGSNSGVSGSGKSKKRHPLHKFDDEPLSEDEYSHNAGGSNPYYFMPTIPVSHVTTSEVELDTV